MTYRWAPIADRLGYTNTRTKRAAIRRATETLTWAPGPGKGQPMLLNNFLALLPPCGPGAITESAVAELPSPPGTRRHLCGWRTSDGATFVALCTTTTGPVGAAALVTDELVLLARRPALTRSAIAA